MDEIPEDTGDRIVVRFDPGGAVELTDLTDSFAALARFYERHFRPEGEAAPRLFVTKLETGSIIAEIMPQVVLVGSLVATLDGGMIVADFTRRLWQGIRAFSGVEDRLPMPPSQDDAEDIKEFIRPLTGKKGASLGLKHAKLEKRDGERSIVVEYQFDETELNRAAINIDKALGLPSATSEGEASPPSKRQPSSPR